MYSAAFGSASQRSTGVARSPMHCWSAIGSDGSSALAHEVADDPDATPSRATRWPVTAALGATTKVRVCRLSESSRPPESYASTVHS